MHLPCSSGPWKMRGGGSGKTLVTDMACIPSIYIKTSQFYCWKLCDFSFHQNSFWEELWASFYRWSLLPLVPHVQGSRMHVWQVVMYFTNRVFIILSDEINISMKKWIFAIITVLVIIYFISTLQYQFSIQTNCWFVCCKGDCRPQ